MKIRSLVDKFKQERQKKLDEKRKKEMSGFFKEGTIKIQHKFIKNLSDNSLKDNSDIVETEDDSKKKNKKLTKSEKDSDSDSDIVKSEEAVMKRDKNDRKTSTHRSKKDADSHSDVVCAEDDVRNKKNLHTKTDSHKSKEKLDSDVVHGEDDAKTKKNTKKRNHKSEQEVHSGTDIQLKRRKGKAASADEKSNEEAMKTSNKNVEMDKENDEVLIDESDKSASAKASGKNVLLITILSSDEEKAEKADESGIDEIMSDEAEESPVTSGVLNDDEGDNEILTNSMENTGDEVVKVDSNDKNDVIEDEVTPARVGDGRAALASAPLENFENNTFMKNQLDALEEANSSLKKEVEYLKAKLSKFSSPSPSTSHIASTQTEESGLLGSSANLPLVEVAGEADVSRDTTQCLQSADPNLNMQNSGTDAVANKYEDETVKDGEKDGSAVPETEKQTSSASDTLDVPSTSGNESMNVGSISSSGESSLSSDGEVLVDQILSDVIGDAMKRPSDVVANVAAAKHEDVNVEKQSDTISRQQMIIDFGLNNNKTDVGCDVDDYEGIDLDIANEEKVNLIEKFTKKNNESGKNEETSNTCAMDAGKKDSHNNDTSSDDDHSNGGVCKAFRSPSPQGVKVVVEKIETYNESKKNVSDKKKSKEPEKKSSENV